MLLNQDPIKLSEIKAIPCSQLEERVHEQELDTIWTLEWRSLLSLTRKLTHL